MILQITTRHSYLFYILFFIFLYINNLSYAQNNNADQIIGTYYVIEPESKEESKVKIYKTASGKYEGRIIWMKNPNYSNGKPKLDIKNPNPNLRNTPGPQIVLLKNFVYDKNEKEWNSGEIYNPVSGKIYKSYLKFETPEKLKVRGYIGVPAFGKSMYWNKL